MDRALTNKKKGKGQDMQDAVKENEKLREMHYHKVEPSALEEEFETDIANVTLLCHNFLAKRHASRQSYRPSCADRP